MEEHIESLQKIPQPDQRTPDWFKFRNDRLTASDWGKIVSGAGFSSRKAIIRKKCGADQKALTNKAIQWGVKYEPVAIMLYELMNGEKVLLFGCLPHPTIPFLGASPDGITKKGIMVEIKCPYSRIITGIPSEEYWIQVQGQLEVCGLEDCDFFECQLREFSTREEYDKSKHQYKGVVLVFMKESMKYKYKYSNIGLHGEELDQWIDKKMKKFERKKKFTFIEHTFWYLEKSSCVRIKRDREWFATKALPKLAKFWDTILECRQDISKINKITYSSEEDEYIPPPPTTECLFEESAIVIKSKELKAIEIVDDCLFS